MSNHTAHDSGQQPVPSMPQSQAAPLPPPKSDSNAHTRPHEAKDLEPASGRAFAVVELLENVLLHLAPVQIIEAQAVCQHWCDIVACSSLLRKRAFLIPDYQFSEPIPGSRYSLNCCYLSYFSPGPKEQILDPLERAGNRAPYLEIYPWVIGTYHTSLLQFEWIRSCRRHDQLKLDRVCTLYDNKMTLNVDLVKECLSQEVKPKYHNMLLCQPPPTSAYLYTEFVYPAGKAYRWRHEVHRADGVRLRDVADALREHLLDMRTWKDTKVNRKMRSWKDTKVQHINKISVHLVGGSQDRKGGIYFAIEGNKETRNTNSAHSGVCEERESGTDAENDCCNELAA